MKQTLFKYMWAIQVYFLHKGYLSVNKGLIGD